MMLQAGQQIITIHILSNIAISEGNPTMKFDQLIKYNVKIFFFKYYAENEPGRLVPDLFLFFKKLRIR